MKLIIEIPDENANESIEDEDETNYIKFHQYLNGQIIDICNEFSFDVTVTEEWDD